MNWLSQKIGWLIDIIQGPRTTRVFEGGTKFQYEKVRPMIASEDVDVGILSTRTIYRTVYERWWMPDHYRCIFTVTCIVPEHMRGSLDPRLLETIHYPTLCNRLLEDSQYGHIYAIHAFLDRILLKPKHTQVPL